MSTKILSDEKLKEILFRKYKLDWRDFDYNDIIKTKYEEDQSKYPTIIRNKKFYINPFLWQRLIYLSANTIMNYILYNHKEEIDYDILGTVIHEDKRNLDLFKKVFSIVYNNYKNKGFKIDYLLFGCVIANDINKLKYTVKFVKDYNIKLNENCSIGNIGDGNILNEAVKTGNIDTVRYLLSLGATKLDWAYVIAVKYANYSIARLLADKGADINFKNLLAYKMLIRNDKHTKLSDKYKEDHDYILNLYKEVGDQ